MKKETLRGLSSWFERYVNSFILDNEDLQNHKNYNNNNILLKKAHCKRVKALSASIAISEGLSSEEVNLASAIGLFHDIGRFMQYKVYGTFLDKESEDHGDLGVRVLKEENLLELVEKEEREIVVTAVRYHNKLELKEDITGKVLLFTKIVRDADKLDIFSVMIAHYKKDNYEESKTAFLNRPDTEHISVEIINSLMEGRIPSYSDMQSVHDFKLLKFGWVYDLNFSYSFRKLKKEKYMETLYSFLPKNESVDKVYNKTALFLAEKCN